MNNIEFLLLMWWLSGYIAYWWAADWRMDIWDALLGFLVAIQGPFMWKTSAEIREQYRKDRME